MYVCTCICFSISEKFSWALFQSSTYVLFIHYIWFELMCVLTNVSKSSCHSICVFYVFILFRSFFLHFMVDVCFCCLCNRKQGQKYKMKTESENDNACSHQRWKR